MQKNCTNPINTTNNIAFEITVKNVRKEIYVMTIIAKCRK
jgi:hypothetical protein